MRKQLDMPKNLTFGQCLKHLWIYIRPNQKKLWIGLALVILMQVIYVIMPLAEGQITSQLQLDVQAINDKIPGLIFRWIRFLPFIHPVGDLYRKDYIAVYFRCNSD